MITAWSVALAVSTICSTGIAAEVSGVRALARRGMRLADAYAVRPKRRKK